jgi:23S rRNA (guanosine2251-2'-O)-methyltransferase
MSEDSTPEATSNVTLVAGRKPVRDLLESEPGRVDSLDFRRGRGQALQPLIDVCKRLGLRHRFVEAAELDRLFPGNHQGVLARVAGLTFTDVEGLLEAARQAPLPLVLALDKVQDPGNVGVLARTLYALGGAGLMVAKHEGAYLGAAAVRASAGACSTCGGQGHQPVPGPDRFAEEGFSWPALAAGGQRGRLHGGAAATRGARARQ